ncbi:exodeoxyribonuclease V subunit gamma, partial [Pseudonocardia sp. SID8383]
PAPAALLGGVVAHVTGTDPATDPWSPGRSVWPLLELIDEAVAAPGDDRFTALAAHLERGGHGRRYALARTLAGLFGSYATHRPELLRRWRAGEDAVPADLVWQPELWRRLHAALGVPGPAERLDDAVARLRGGA